MFVCMYFSFVWFVYVAMCSPGPTQYLFHMPMARPHAGSGVVRMDPLRFLAGCHTRRLNQASLSYLSMLYYCIVVY